MKSPQGRFCVSCESRKNRLARPLLHSALLWLPRHRQPTEHSTPSATVTAKWVTKESFQLPFLSDQQNVHAAWESLWIVVVACGGTQPESQTAVSALWPMSLLECLSGLGLPNPRSKHTQCQ